MAGLYYQENMDRRYQTPESFRTGKVVEEQERPITPPSSYRRREPEGNTPERRDGAESQQRDFKMSNQVFGNSTKPEPLNLGQMHHEPREEYDLSPRRRQDYYDQQRPYRGGRPDLGPENDIYVPYPQEPKHRSKGQGYMQPPSIGHAHHGSEANPKQPDRSLEDKCGPHPGWLVFVRFQRDAEDQVQRALYMCQKHIDSDGGRILGLGRPNGIRIREGGENWVTFGKLRHYGGGVWNPQDSPMEEETPYCLLAIYYPSLSRAKQWWDRDSCFKQKDFPKPNGADCIVLPLSSSVDTGFCKTLVMSVFPKISHAEYFRDNFSVPTENMMRKRFRASPYVVKTTYVPVDDSRHRVAQHLRGCWLPRNSIVTVSTFESLQEAHRYFSDPEYLQAKRYQDMVTSPTTLVVDLGEWRHAYSYGQR